MSIVRHGRINSFGSELCQAGKCGSDEVGPVILRERGKSCDRMNFGGGDDGPRSKCMGGGIEEYEEGCMSGMEEGGEYEDMFEGWESEGVRLEGHERGLSGDSLCGVERMEREFRELDLCCANANLKRKTLLRRRHSRADSHGGIYGIGGVDAQWNCFQVGDDVEKDWIDAAVEHNDRYSWGKNESLHPKKVASGKNGYQRLARVEMVGKDRIVDVGETDIRDFVDEFQKKQRTQTCAPS